MTIPSARQPAHVLILSAFLLYGLATPFFYDQIVTNSIRQFPEPWGRAFIAVMSLGAAMYLWTAWRNTLHAIVRVERAAHWLLIALFLIYAMWSVDVNGARGAAFSIVLVALAGASVWRLLQIRTFRRAAAIQARERAEQERYDG